MNVFSAKFGGMPHPPMTGFKQSVKVFSAKYSLPTDSRKFTAIRYALLQEVMTDFVCHMQLILSRS